MGETDKKSRLTQKSLRREIVSQIERALEEVNAISACSDTLVHRVRRRSKRIRAELRLMRPICRRASKKASRHVRDASAALSPFRDAQIIPSALASVSEKLRQADGVGDQTVLDWLSHIRFESNLPVSSLREATKIATVELTKAREVMLGAEIEPRKRLSAQALFPSYQNGRQWVRTLLCSPDADAFHELRKTVKSHFYECRFMKPTYSQALAARIEWANRLGDLLGEAQDIAVLQQYCREADVSLDHALVETFIASCERVAETLRDKALAHACHLYFLTADEFVDYLKATSK